MGIRLFDRKIKINFTGPRSEELLVDLEKCKNRGFSKGKIEEILKGARAILETMGFASPLCLGYDTYYRITDVLANRKERKKILANPFPIAAQILAVQLRCQRCILQECEDRDPNYPLEDKT